MVKKSRRQHCTMTTPIGELYIEACADGLTRVCFTDAMEAIPNPQAMMAADDGDRSSAWLLAAQGQLSEYFRGDRTVFDLPLCPEGTAFQKHTWSALCQIPYGERQSYQALAQRLCKPKAARAVGAANGKNPIFIVVPCHRVIAKNGDLSGYAGGIERKRWLLALERNGHC